MKALNLYAPGDLRYEDVTTPVPKRGEVLVKIKASGICGSDISRVLEKGTYHFPTIPGHEFSGEIIELGEDVDNSWLHKKATVFPVLPCQKCEPCQIGEYAQCTDYNYFGSRCNGGFAEYIAVPVWNIVLVPDSLSCEEAAMTEPAAVAIHALRQASLEMGDNVVIFGAGPIGLMLAQWSRAWGADKVMLIDIDESKIEFAKKQGFDLIYNSQKGNTAEWIKNNSNGRGADIAVEGAGVSQTLEQCLFCTRSFGKVVLMGNPAKEMTLSQKAYWEILRKQLKIAGTWNSSYVSLPKNDWELAIRSMETGKINVKPFITHRLPLSEGIKPFSMMRDRKEFYNKVMFTID